MSENKCFTFIWKIKNFSFSISKSYIPSPIFIVQAIHNLKWKLSLYIQSGNFPECIACYIEREKYDSSPIELDLDCELSFLTVDGSVLHSKKFLMKVNKEGPGSSCDPTKALCAKKNEVYIFKKDLFIPDDILTIRCRMWDNRKLISLSGRCFAKTQIKTECRSFIGRIENFSNLEPKENYRFSVKQSSTENFLPFMNLWLAADGNLRIEITPGVSSPFSNYKCKVFILDVFKNKTKVGKGEIHDKKYQCIVLTLQKDYLTANKTHYLPYDVLTVECEFIYSFDWAVQNDALEYGFQYNDSQEIISNEIKTKLPTEKYHNESVSTLKDDLNVLFMEGTLCDTKLKTATETFPVHRAVLSARSPVFKSMFTIDMREKTNNCVDIDDLDADTVRRMLKFMYLDTLDDLEYESAKSLYFAADKYSIVSLRHECSYFLKQNMLPTNCCDILLLADNHQDKDLKNSVQDCIARNDEVLFSEEWTNLAKNHPHLTTEVFRAIYMKNRKS